MKKVGEHVTIDFLGVKKEYSPDFYNKVIYKIAKKAKIEVMIVLFKSLKLKIRTKTPKLIIDQG